MYTLESRAETIPHLILNSIRVVTFNETLEVRTGSTQRIAYSQSLIKVPCCYRLAQLGLTHSLFIWNVWQPLGL